MSNRIAYAAYGYDGRDSEFFDSPEGAEDWVLGDGGHPEDWRQVEVAECESCGGEFDIEGKKWHGSVCTDEGNLFGLPENCYPPEYSDLCTSCYKTFTGRRYRSGKKRYSRNFEE